MRHSNLENYVAKTGCVPANLQPKFCPPPPKKKIIGVQLN